MTSQSQWIWCNAWSQFELRDISDIFLQMWKKMACVCGVKRLTRSQAGEVRLPPTSLGRLPACGKVTLQLQFTWSPFVRTAQHLRDDMFVLMPKYEAQWDPCNWAKAASLVSRKWWNNTFSYRMMHVRLIKIQKLPPSGGIQYFNEAVLRPRFYLVHFECLHQQRMMHPHTPFPICL